MSAEKTVLVWALSQLSLTTGAGLLHSIGLDALSLACIAVMLVLAVCPLAALLAVNK